MKTLKLVFACLLMISFMLTSCQKEEIVIDTMTPVETGTTEAGKRLRQVQQFTPELEVNYSTSVFSCCWTSHYVIPNPATYMTTPNKSFVLYINGTSVGSNTTGVFSFNHQYSGSHSYQVKVVDTNGYTPVGSLLTTVNHAECTYC